MAFFAQPSDAPEIFTVRRELLQGLSIQHPRTHRQIRHRILGVDHCLSNAARPGQSRLELARLALTGNPDLEEMIAQVAGLLFPSQPTATDPRAGRPLGT
jgi:hypothetical protein